MPAIFARNMKREPSTGDTGLCSNPDLDLTIFRVSLKSIHLVMYENDTNIQRKKNLNHIFFICFIVRCDNAILGTMKVENLGMNKIHFLNRSVSWSKAKFQSHMKQVKP